MTDREQEELTKCGNETATIIIKSIKDRGIDLDKVFGDNFHGDTVSIIFEQLEELWSNLGLD